MSDSDMTNSCSSCGSSSSCGGSDCSTCGGCSTDANQHSTITLTMEDDTEVECAILTIFPVDAKEYIALLPLDENGDNTDGQIYLYRFIDNGEEEEPGLENIEEDEEFDRVSAIFNEWLDTQDFGDIDLDALDDLED